MSAVAHYRRFWRAYNRFHRFGPWIWVAGCLGCVAVSAAGFGEDGLKIVCLTTIYPFLVGWLAFNGYGFLLRSWIRYPKVRLMNSQAVWIRWAYWTTIGTLMIAFSAIMIGVMVKILAA